MWLQLFLWVASFILSDFFRARLPSQTPAGVGDFNIPTATEGRYVPIIPGGRIRIGAPNCVWYGDFAAIARTVETGVIFKRDEVVGFRYELALQYVLARGESFGITKVWIGEDLIFDDVATTVVDIDRDDLFGGADGGGGFVGRLRLFTGSGTQAKSAYLDSRLDPLSAYRGYSYIMITSLDETRGADIGESNNLRFIRVELQTFSTLAQTGLGNRLALAGDTHIIGEDANPIAVLYEIYLNEEWGRNFPPSDIDLGNFQAVAAVVFAEGIGYSELIDGVTTTGALVDVIEQHVDGYVGPNPITGLIEITLARFDYVLANEFQADASTVKEVSKWDKGDWTQTFNQTRCKYSDRSKSYKDTYALAQSSGNRIITGRLKSKDIEYPGVHAADVANKIVARDQRGLAQPIASGTIMLDRSAYLLRPGSVLSFTDSEVGETDLAVRCSKVTIGGPLKNQIAVEVVQDVFDTEVVGVADPPPSDFEPPIQAVVPLAVADQRALECPWILQQRDSNPNTVPRAFTIAREGGNANAYQVIFRTRTPPAPFAGAYFDSEVIQSGFMLVGELRNAETGWQAGNGTGFMQIDGIAGASLDVLIGAHDPNASAESVDGIAVIEPGTVNEEWVATSSIISDLAGIRLVNIWRGCADTGMKAHSAGARIWFIFTGGAGLPLEAFTAGDGVDLKYLPSSPSDAVLEPAATSLAELLLDNGALGSRFFRPLLPIDFDAINDGGKFGTTINADNGAAVSFTTKTRLYNVLRWLDSVQGLNTIGQPFLVVPSGDIKNSYWLYNLDVTPSPTRGDAILTIIDQQTVQSNQLARFQRLDLINEAGIVANFNARIEIEVSHDPGELSLPAPAISRELFFWDFAITGTWDATPGGSVYADIYFHSHWDGADAAVVATDESDNVHTITFNGNAQLDTAQSVFGGAALLLDGTGDFCTIPDGAGISLGNLSWTIETRVRFNGDPGVANMAIVSQWTETGNQRAWKIALENNALVLSYSIDGTAVATVSEAWNPNGDQWYTLAVVRDGANIRLFIDGFQLGTDTDIGAGTTFHNSTGLVWFGAFDGAANDYLNGWLDETRIHPNRARYDANYTVPLFEFFFHRVALLLGFEELDGAQTNTSEDRAAQTVSFFNDAAVTRGFAVAGVAALALDGVGDFVTVPDNARFDLGDEDFTIELFARQVQTPTAGRQGFVTQYRASTNQRAWALSVSNPTGFQNVQFIYSADGIAETVVEVLWAGHNGIFTFHIAVVRKGADLKIYVDGFQLGATHNIGATVLHSSNVPVSIGAVETIPTDPLDGFIDEVRVTQGLALYDGNFTVPTVPFPRE